MQTAHSKTITFQPIRGLLAFIATVAIPRCLPVYDRQLRLKKELAAEWDGRGLIQAELAIAAKQAAALAAKEGDIVRFLGWSADQPETARLKGSHSSFSLRLAPYPLAFQGLEEGRYLRLSMRDCSKQRLLNLADQLAGFKKLAHDLRTEFLCFQALPAGQYCTTWPSV